MTAINIACLRHLQCVHLVTDTAHYNAETGVIHKFATKVHPVPEWPGIVTGRGISTATKLLAAALAERFKSFDDAVERLVGAFPEIADDIIGAETYELIIAGISKVRGIPEAYVFHASDEAPEGCTEADRLDPSKIMPAAMQLVRLPDLVAGPVPPQEMLRAAKFQPIRLTGDSDDVISGLRHVIEMQRRSLYPGVSGSRVGGRAELTSILPFGIKQTVITEWCDKEGEPINLDEIDWDAWRAINKPAGEHWYGGARTFLPSGKTPVHRSDNLWAKRRSQLLNKTVQQRIAALGALATVEDHVKATEDLLKLARLNGVNITKNQIGILKDVTRAQAEFDLINKSAAVGIFDVAAATTASNDQLKAWEETGVVNKNSAEQMAAAHQVLAEKIKQSANAAALAATPYKQLKQMEIDYADTAKMVDTAAASSLQGIESGLLDLTTGSKTAGQAFQDMGLSGVKALEDMIIKMTIIEPLAKSLQSILKGSGGSPLSLNASDYSGGFNIFSTIGHLFGFADGGSFVVPAGPGAMALPGFANGADWTVPGSGAPDSKVTAFRVSPGERVTVTPPGRGSGGGAGGGVLQIEVSSSVDKNGNITTFVQKVSGQVAGQIVQYARQGIVNDTVSAVSLRNKNAPGYLRNSV